MIADVPGLARSGQAPRPPTTTCNDHKQPNRYYIYYLHHLSLARVTPAGSAFPVVLWCGVVDPVQLHILTQISSVARRSGSGNILAKGCTELGLRFICSITGGGAGINVERGLSGGASNQNGECEGNVWVFRFRFGKRPTNPTLGNQQTPEAM